MRQPRKPRAPRKPRERRWRNSKPVERVWMSREEYAEYLKGDHWKETKRRFYNSVYFYNKCEVCGRKPERYDIHHKTYDRLGKEELSDLAALCHTCHELIHILQFNRSRECKMDGHKAVRKLRKMLGKYRVPGAIAKIYGHDWNEVYARAEGREPMSRYAALLLGPEAPNIEKPL